ncbi:hypothetical protein OESDEN_19626 [Oesophagostomum dentatum]|uniref:Uncharacterized protein n=1 Tax=Oesophagostomum dentatum TaxID=61180 RepID=A0A0B1SBX3_OESDE|nr:hypothetical protein OESDEN_19626 [Oesophagostomum dentatum]
MGCFNATEHWDYIELCFKSSGREIACSYDQYTRMGFDTWGTAFCCCRGERCNQLPPEWLTLSTWGFRWRICSIFLLVITVTSFAYFSYGIFEARNARSQERRVRCLF